MILTSLSPSDVLCIESSCDVLPVVLLCCEYIHHQLGKSYKHIIPFWNIIPTYVGIRYKQKNRRQ
jgi:hypothetical protein